MNPRTPKSAPAMASPTRPDNYVLVVFGATGDLAKRKLLPGLFRLAAGGLLPKQYRIIGSAPRQFSLSDSDFKKHAKDAVEEFGGITPTPEAWQNFEAALSFASADPDDTAPLLAAVDLAEKEIGSKPRRLFHLAVPPAAFRSMVELLGASKLNVGSRIIIEKPFGTDLASAVALNKTVHSVFDESQVFRIDHFLGKESVDNILALRFANQLFEPVWNRDHISHVQIDVPETLSIEGRANFYDATGAFRDMVVTHLFQVLGVIAMEPPSKLTAEALRNEEVKVFDALVSINPKHVVRGQYEGYLQEDGVAPNSTTETMVAVEAKIDNWRWSGVPFYLRSGKSLGANRQVVTLGFRQPCLKMFAIDRESKGSGSGGEIVIDFGDPGSITSNFLAKEPGPVMRLGRASMVFEYQNSFNAANELEGYEHLILEAMLGDQSLFTRADGIERLWEVSAPLIENPPPVEPYARGTWGPDSINRLIAPHAWHLPET